MFPAQLWEAGGLSSRCSIWARELRGVYEDPHQASLPDALCPPRADKERGDPRQATATCVSDMSEERRGVATVAAHCHPREMPSPTLRTSSTAPARPGSTAPCFRVGALPPRPRRAISPSSLGLLSLIVGEDSVRTCRTEIS